MEHNREGIEGLPERRGPREAKEGKKNSDPVINTLLSKLTIQEKTRNLGGLYIFRKEKRKVCG